MNANKPSASNDNCAFTENFTGAGNNVRMGTSTTITSSPQSPGKEPGCGIKRSISRRCKRGLSCIMGLSSVKAPTKMAAESNVISQPANVVHVTHVGFDERTGEYTGLPKEWKQILSQGARPVSSEEASESTSKRRSRRISRE